MQNKSKRGKSPISKLVLFLGVLCFAVGMFFILRELFFPKAYSDTVEEYCEYYNIDTDFIFAVINTESGFNTNAVSDVGASGLMQIMEDAFLWTRKHLNAVHTDIEYSDMMTPEYNIEYGSCMLAFYYDKYGSYELAAAAYHAGTNQVDRWLHNGDISKDNFKISDIPSDTTSHYVKKLMWSYKAYDLLYD